MDTKYFTPESLGAFASSQGKNVKQVVCCIWQNLTDPNNPTEIIDHVQLRFADSSMLAIGCDESGEGLEVIKPNLKETSQALELEFGGKIKLHAVDASGTSMWKDVTGKNLQAVQITKEGEHYRSDSVMLNFGEEKRTITLNPLDGILLDYYED
jgi:hypothetical protein